MPSLVLLAGALCFVVGPALYFWQLKQKVLVTPWYIPGLSTLGAVTMVGMLYVRPNVWRGILCAGSVVLCGLEWYGLGVGVSTPVYHGPVRVGSAVPAFSTQLSSGLEFTNQDLTSAASTILVFFRGRW
ncbi:MAG: hypothetical protein O2931_06305 [Planctomycetota bacterium]|nr:hypothetical protein [Planctomycetota bacterium]MDA1178393.1 hypothetical protein [Planctomycetota bacterium]